MSRLDITALPTYLRRNLTHRILGLVALIIIVSMSGTTASPAAQLLSSLNSGECVHRPRGFTPDGTPMFLFGCHGVPNEQWTIANGQITAIDRQSQRRRDRVRRRQDDCPTLASRHGVFGSERLMHYIKHALFGSIIRNLEE